MTGVLYAIGKACARHRFVVLGVWLVVAVLLVGISKQMGDNTNDNLSLPGTNSDQATTILDKSFPVQANGTSPIILHAPSGGKLTDSKYSSAVNTAASDVAKNPNVASVVNPLTQQGSGQLSKDQSTGYLSVGLKVSPGSLSEEDAQNIINAAADPAKAAGLEVQTGGQLGGARSCPRRSRGGTSRTNGVGRRVQVAVLGLAVVLVLVVAESFPSPLRSAFRPEAVLGRVLAGRRCTGWASRCRGPCTRRSTRRPTAALAPSPRSRWGCRSARRWTST